MLTGTRRRELRLFFIILIPALLMWSFPVRAAEVLSVTVPDVVRTEGTACALSEIAALDGPPELTRRVGALLLTVRDDVIERQQVIDALKVSGLEGVRIELKMPTVVRVVGRPDETDMSGSGNAAPESVRDLSAAVRGLAAWDWDVEVQCRGEIPEGRLVYPVSLVPGTSAATLRFRDAAGRERALAVRLIWRQPVLVLTRSVKKDQILSDSDFVVRQMQISRPGVYASRLDEAAGRQVRKNLSQGEPLPLNVLVSTPIIERGQKVTIIVSSGNLTVRAQGEALESGVLGDTIKVRNLSGRTVLQGVVTGRETVEVTVP